MEKGVFVSCSVGNSGPNVASLANVAPWIMTVGAGTLSLVYNRCLHHSLYPDFAKIRTGRMVLVVEEKLKEVGRNWGIKWKRGKKGFWDWGKGKLKEDEEEDEHEQKEEEKEEEEQCQRLHVVPRQLRWDISSSTSASGDVSVQGNLLTGSRGIFACGVNLEGGILSKKTT